MLWYDGVINGILEKLTRQIKEADNAIWRYGKSLLKKSTKPFFIINFSYLVGFKKLITGIENTGASVVYGINYYGRGYLRTENYINYITHDVLGRDLLNSTFNYVPCLRSLYHNLTNFPEYGSIKDM